MGASLASRLDYAAWSRLDGIGHCEIGNITASAVTSNGGTGERFTSVAYTQRLSPLLKARCKLELEAKKDCAALLPLPLDTDERLNLPHGR